MSDWLQRVRPTIQFTSPVGNTFEALWISNTTPQEKIWNKDIKNHENEI